MHILDPIYLCLIWDLDHTYSSLYTLTRTYVVQLYYGHLGGRGSSIPPRGGDECISNIVRLLLYSLKTKYFVVYQYRIHQ